MPMRMVGKIFYVTLCGLLIGIHSRREFAQVFLSSQKYISYLSVSLLTRALFYMKGGPLKKATKLDGGSILLNIDLKKKMSR